MIINAFCTAKLDEALKSADRVVYCGEKTKSNAKVDAFYSEYDSNDKAIYLPSMCDETALENACDHIVINGSQMIVRAAYDLNEAGIIEARYKLSPIMLLHKLGVLNNCIVVGGVCLDNDDLDLMAQESVPLVITPTASAGYGYGFAPISAAINRGIRVGIGTFDGKYNKAVSMTEEVNFLRLTANAQMSCENALSDAQIEKILRFE